MPSDQRRLIEHAKFRASFRKTNKKDWTARKKHIDAITNQNKRLAALSNKDNDYKKIFEEPVKERFDKVKELTNKLNQNDLIYYFKSNPSRKKIWWFQ